MGDKKDKNKSKNKNKKRCFIETHFTELIVSQSCNGEKKLYFKDDTKNHNKALVSLYNDSGCIMKLYVNGKKYASVEPGSSFAVQKEDVRKVHVKCIESAPTYTITVTQPVNDAGQAGYQQANLIPPQEFCFGFLTIEKTFCICCDGKKKKKSCCCD